jgi:hypothetical protein
MKYRRRRLEHEIDVRARLPLERQDDIDDDRSGSIGVVDIERRLPAREIFLIVRPVAFVDELLEGTSAGSLLLAGSVPRSVRITHPAPLPVNGAW